MPSHDEQLGALLRAVAASPVIALPDQLAAPFERKGRFKLIRRLGSGGMGVVYEAMDEQRGLRVALKTLRDVDANLLYRLKREFRSLRDLSHRNLIVLHELFEEAGQWFFTMELIDGDDLYSYFGWGDDAASTGSAAYRHTALVTAEQARSSDVAPATIGGAAASASDLPAPWPAGRDAGPQPPAVDFDRVRDVLVQIAEGLIAIHDAGQVHRDIKPSNIMITRDGRAVILDFGLAMEQCDASSGEGEIVGTVVYMAPEQAAAQAVGPPADWYSLGVILYETLTGQRLFRGPWHVVLVAKQQAHARNPKELNPACPDDLAALCVELLHTDPQLRPHGAEVLRRLNSRKHRPTAPGIRAAHARSRGVFVGRARELGELHQARADLAGGAAIAVFVHGESGIGKTTLIHHFVSALDQMASRPVVLTGQCRQHEAIPFKAMDGIIDALARYVSRLSDVAAAELVPKNAALLPSVFPVLERIAAVAKAPRSAHAVSDPFQRRKRVFAALREMLCRLTERHQLICVIDDMQWVDSDSLHLLRELLSPPDEPPLLLLASVRSELGELKVPWLPCEVRCVRLQPLDPQESLALAGLLLDRIAPDHKLQSMRIVDETGGHPLFIGELVRYAAGASGADLVPLRLDEAIWARASQLDAMALGVLEILSMAVAPLAEDIVRAAARLDANAFQHSLAVLRADHLVRSVGSTQAALDVYHDRVRQAVLRHVAAADRIAQHARIAAALEHAGAQVQPEMLIYHLEGARQLDRAAHQALEAAERALAGLALEQAIELFETALGLSAWPDAERRAILIKLGGALAAVGRGPDAARVYADAATGADPITQLSCRIQEAEQLVQSGHLDRGAALLFSLFREHGHDVPGSQRQTLARIAWYRLGLALRGLRWTARPRSEIAPRELAVLTLYKAAARGLILVDPVRAGYFVVRGLHLAMTIGDRDFINYFLMLETGIRASEGGGKHRAFVGKAHAYLRSVADPLFHTIYQSHLATLSHLRIDREFKQSFEQLERSDEAFSQLVNVAWEASACRFFLLSNVHKMGDFVRLRAYSERYRREAEQCGNIYARTTISRLCNLLWLVADDPAGARVDLETGSWAFTLGYHLQHWHELNARVDIAIYEGSSIDSAFFSGHLRAFNKSAMQRVLGYRCETAWLIARAALADARQTRLRRRVVRKSIARLFSYKTHYSRMLAHMVRATLAVHDGELAAAARDFREVIALGEAADIVFVTAAARRRLGVLVGGDEGRELVATAEQWMRDAGIRNLDRMTYLASPCRLEIGAAMRVSAGRD